MKVLDRTISGWQAGILMFILIFANKVLVLPSLLYERAHFESVFVLAILFALELGALFLFYKFKKAFPSQSLVEILRNKFGKVVQIVVYILIMVYFLSKAVLLYNVSYIFFRNVIYKDYSNLLFLFCFIPIINHLAICGLRVIGRTAQLFFPIILIIVIFCIIVGVFGINSSVLLFSTSFSQCALTAFKHLSSFGDIIFLFVAMDKIKVKNGEWKYVFMLVSLACLLVVGVALVFILSYADTSFLHPYAIFEIMSYVKEYGGLGRIDIVSMIVIIIFTYFQLAIYLKGFMLAFDGIFNKIDRIYSLLTFNFLFLTIVDFFILNLEMAVIYGENVLPYLIVVPYILIPLLAGITLIFKKRKHRESGG